MAITGTAALGYLLFALPISFWVAFSDMKLMKIPNLAVLALFAGFLIVSPFVIPFGQIPWQLLNLVAVLCAGFILNMAGLVGAGDAKFAAAMAPLVARGDAVFFCYLFAAVILAAFVTHRAFRAMPAIRAATPDWASWERRDFPMGLALGGALSLYLVIGAITG